MFKPETRESIANLGATTRNVSLGVAACYFALATELAFPRLIVDYIVEYGLAGCTAQLVKDYFSPEQ